MNVPAQEEKGKSMVSPARKGEKEEEKGRLGAACSPEAGEEAGCEVLSRRRRGREGGGSPGEKVC